MTLFRVYIVFICLAFKPLLHAQSLPFQKYSSKDGLVSDRITTMAQDEEGFIWFGSYFGLCRYDGIKFQKIDLPSSQQNKYVSGLLPLNNKLYATFLFEGGLAEYDHGRVRSYFISNGSNEFTCMTNGPNGSVFLCNTANQVYQFINGSFRFITLLQGVAPSGAKYMVGDAANSLWIGTEQGLYILPYPYKTAEHFFINENISSLTKDADGTILFTHSKNAEATTESCQFYTKGFVNRKITGSIKDLRETKFSGKDTKGIWVSDHYNHLIHIEGASKKIYAINLDQSADINAVLVDREENIWIANDPGVVKISNLGIKTYFFDQSAPAAALATYANDSVLWATNCKSLYRISNNHFEKIDFPMKQPDYFGRLHFDKNQNLWFGLWNGGIWRTKWKGNVCIEKEFYRDLGETIKVHSIAEDSKGTIFIGGINGLFVFQNGKFIQHFHPQNSYGGPAFINDIALDEKNQTLWLADNAAGIIQLKYTEAKNGFDLRVQQFINASKGLTDSYVRSICLDKNGVLWAGTRSGGIYKILPRNNSFSVSNCNKEAQINCSRIAHIVSNENGVWFASCDGAVHYDFATNSWRRFGTPEGILNNEVLNIAAHEANNSVTILTAQGIAQIDLTQREKTAPPLVSITGVNVMSQPDTIALHGDQLRQYEYDQNSIGFEFVGLSFIDERKVRYKYMLEGFDKHWSNAVTTNSVNYASLPPGKYVFKVMAANARGEWSTSSATFSFQIIIPFYKTSWFLLGVFSIVVLLIYFIREQRIKQRLRMERLRLTIARDLHDDIGSTLGSINLLSKSAIRKFQKAVLQEETVSVFEKIGQSAETTLDAMDDIVWTINPAKDKFEDLVVRMREFAIPLLEAADISFVCNTSGNADQSISMNVRKSSFLIFKESIHNIIKHANASSVTIHVTLNATELSMIITDNGNGFIAEKQTSRNGLRNMHHRAASVNGFLKITSSDEGTEIIFQVPLR